MSMEEKKEKAKNEAWFLAVKHAERADQIAERLHTIFLKATEDIEKERIISAYYLTLAGYGEDREAHYELGLPFDEQDI